MKESADRETSTRERLERIEDRLKDIEGEKGLLTKKKILSNYPQKLLGLIYDVLSFFLFFHSYLVSLNICMEMSVHRV